MPYLRKSPAPNDRLQISQDRRTLTVQCSAGGEADQVRVLVASDDVVAAMAAPHPGASRPFHGRPFEVGATIEAEDFDVGDDGVAYYDETPDQLSTTYRPGASVELLSAVEEESSAVFVDQSLPGERVAYTVEIDRAGRYVVEAVVGSRYGGGRFHVEFGDSASTRPMEIPKTGERTVTETIGSQPVELPAGRHVMRVMMDIENREGWIGIFDSFRIRPSAYDP